MTKRELIMDVAERLGHTQSKVADVVQAILDSITEALAEGERIEIRNFGVFEVRKRDARIGRNPRTGLEVPVPEKRVALFKAGKALRKRIEFVQPREKENVESTRPTHRNTPTAGRTLDAGATDGSQPSRSDDNQGRM